MPGKVKALKKVLKVFVKKKVKRPGKKFKGIVRTGKARKTIHHDRELCNDCGACVSLCPVVVLWLDKRSILVVESEKCIGCGNCVDACPRRALSLG